MPITDRSMGTLRFAHLRVLREQFLPQAGDLRLPAAATHGFRARLLPMGARISASILSRIFHSHRY
ncbi:MULTISPECIES: hypothetical protein [unclassified Microbulbifer]|uniref:hypothetical protein n=1 Tax=unclassified Microbulbifer TaxID=2619833 RepID=UPI0027E40431|nr:MULTISPECIES: hypothetical protein [unclassified Microbulbifer]